MFCRFCGAHLAADSLFCSRCGKRLASGDSGSSSRLSKRLGLKTPYPWAVVLFIVFGVWAWWPEPPGPDLSGVELVLELQAQSSLPSENLSRHYLSLVVSNVGSESVRDISVEFYAAIVPEQAVEIVSEFRGGRFVVLRDGEPRPIVLLLSDEIAPDERRRFPIDNVVVTAAPAEITYTVAIEDSGEVLTSLSAQITGDPAGDLARQPGATLTQTSFAGER